MLALKPAPRTATPPAKIWRNYYRVYRVLHLYPHGATFPGVHPGPDVFVSKEIAEQHALIFLGMVNQRGCVVMDHAGAYPEGRAH